MASTVLHVRKLYIKTVPNIIYVYVGRNSKGEGEEKGGSSTLVGKQS